MKKILFFITLFIIATSSALAEEVILIKNRIGNIYSNYYDKNLERERFFFADKYIFGDTIAYCLELGKPLDSNIYTYTTSFEEANIDESALEFIKIATYYGYDYPGHDTDNYYMATQEIIWNRMTNRKINWVEDMDLEKKIDISKEKKDIMTLFGTHYKKPSFDGQEIDFILGQELILEDTNNILDRYITNSKNVAIEGNKLILKKDFNEEEITFTKPNYTGKNFLLYTSGLSQKMLSVGGIDNVTSTLKIKIINGTLEINKLDKDTKSNIAQGEAILNGAEYALYNEEGILIDTIITGKKNKVEKLPIGKYTLKEITPSEGYLLDKTIYNIEITKENPNIKLNVYEEVIKRKIDIFKVFASNTTGELTPESGISFEVYDKNDILLETITTDKDGYTSITLPYGKYTFKQINTTENYYKVKDFKITISEQDERPIYKLLSDSEIKAKVKIIKKDLDTKENITNSNIKFKIYDVKNKKYLSLKVSYPENQVTEDFQIDKNGIFITPTYLSPGTYILEELREDLNGYLYNSEKVTFEIGESSNFILEDNETILEIPFYNKIVKGNIIITKYGEEIKYKDNTYYYKEIPLEGVKLNLYAKEDIYENSNIIYKKDELIKEIITNKEGVAQIQNLPLGKYYIKEISTTIGHILDTNIYDIKLQYKDENTKVVEESLKINNYLSKGKLEINKYETNTNVPIPNTLVEVYTKDNKIIYKGYTDENGQIIIEDLPYGEYYLSETEAATGYRILEDTINFELNKEKEEITIYNERIHVPNTGLTLNAIDIIIIISSIISILLIIIFPNKGIISLISIILILIGMSHFVIKIYKYHIDKIKNIENIEAYLNNEPETLTEEKYQYTSVLEIPKLNIKRGILDINNSYNKAKYNIELVKEDNTIIVLAAHNGNNPNSYFGTLKNIELGDEIKYYKDGVIYTYIYSEHYNIKKNGYADIYRDITKKSIVLITCKDNTDDAQTIYIGYLKEERTY